jgi:hypothetical protein
LTLQTSGPLQFAARMCSTPAPFSEIRLAASATTETITNFEPMTVTITSM